MRFPWGAKISPLGAMKSSAGYACRVTRLLTPPPRGAGGPRRRPRGRRRCSCVRVCREAVRCDETHPLLRPPAPREPSVQADLRRGGSSFLDPPAPCEPSVQADLRQGGSSFDPLSTPLEWPRSLCSSRFPASSADSLLGSKETRAGCYALATDPKGADPVAT